MLARLTRLLGGRPRPAKPSVLVVLGMHRSGTSVITSMLHGLGLRLDDELVAPAVDNPRGFWESRRIVDLHEALLATLQRSWKQPFLTAPLPDGWWNDRAVQPVRAALVDLVRREAGRPGVWGFKDPRTARLLPLWHAIFAEAGVEPVWLLVYRHPAAVMRSLASRNKLDPAVAELLWIEHNLDVLDQVDAARLTVLGFDRMAARPASTLRLLAQRLALPQGVVADEVVKAAFVPDMVHHPSEGACTEFARLIHAQLQWREENPGRTPTWPGSIASIAARDIAWLTASALGAQDEKCGKEKQEVAALRSAGSITNSLRFETNGQLSTKKLSHLE